MIFVKLIHIQWLFSKQVTSCRFNEKLPAASCVVEFGKEKLPMIGHESIECTLKIQRWKLGARES